MSKATRKGFRNLVIHGLQLNTADFVGKLRVRRLLLKHLAHNIAAARSAPGIIDTS